MILKSVQRLGTNLRTVAAGMVLLSVVAGASLPAPSASAAATYSCGTYSSGAYSANTACGGTTSGSGTGTGTVGAPNTGFVKLMEPVNLTAILGSSALLIAGIAIMLKSRSHKRRPASFDSRD